MRNPAMIPASRIPVPLEERKLSLKIAASGFAPTGTIGGVRWTSPSSPSMANLNGQRASNAFFTKGSPQTRMKSVRISHGSQA